MYLRLGWRNIWRNPRRTTVILIAIIIGVWSMIFLGALMRGMTDQMIRNGIATLTGHIQIHQRDYRNDPAVENSIEDPAPIEAALDERLPTGAHWSARIRVTATAANARYAGGVTLVGVDPQMEARVSFIGKAIKEGRYLREDDPFGIVVGRALAEKFETGLGKKLVLMTQDTEKNIASRAFRIVGIYRAEMEATEKQFVFVTLPAAREMLKLEKGISEISILLPGHEMVAATLASLRDAPPLSGCDVESWRNLLPLMRAYLEIYDSFIFLWYLVVFIAMAFGIVNTTLMAIFERIREFGLFKSLGMKPWWIIKEVMAESFFLLLLGILIGNILSFLSVFLLMNHGIDLTRFAAGSEFFGISRVIYPSVYGRDVLLANLVVFILGLVVSLYPALKAARFKPVEALAHV
ncbi:MAG: ABC transporter permease [Deltaproteobacteria bacterium]|nr:ABC transporter permease [Deltaproteobacteria bacterium]